MEKVIKAWCSYCFQLTDHTLIKENTLFRNEYRCSSCSNYTVKCMFCDNMAKYKPAEEIISKRDKPDSYIQKRKDNWANLCCAEHDGTIAKFDNLNIVLEDLKDYKKLFENREVNIAKWSKNFIGTVAGIALFAPLAFYAAPGIASSVGGTGMLLSSGTGTAINSLSGAALTSASLAAIGPGGVAGGIACVTAAGTALGGALGAVTSNAYFGEIKDFDIYKVKEGKGPSIIFINGLLSNSSDIKVKDWVDSLKQRFKYNPYYYISWEKKLLANLGGLFSKGATSLAFKKAVATFGKKASKVAIKKTSPIMWAEWVTSLVNNPWHRSVVKAQMTGILLADLLARTNNPEGFILMGHSLGARVIYYALQALSTKDQVNVVDVYLLGGAVGNSEEDKWEKAAKSVSGKIYNCYSKNDKVLSILYRSAMAFLSRPVGVSEIKTQNKTIVNVDVSDMVSGHTSYKKSLRKILKNIHATNCSKFNFKNIWRIILSYVFEKTGNKYPVVIYVDTEEMTFHNSSCSKIPSVENLLILTKRKDAINKGFHPCRLCQPEDLGL